MISKFTSTKMPSSICEMLLHRKRLLKCVAVCVVSLKVEVKKKLNTLFMVSKHNDKIKSLFVSFHLE